MSHRHQVREPCGPLRGHRPRPRPSRGGRDRPGGASEHRRRPRLGRGPRPAARWPHRHGLRVDVGRPRRRCRRCRTPPRCARRSRHPPAADPSARSARRRLAGGVGRKPRTSAGRSGRGPPDRRRASRTPACGPTPTFIARSCPSSGAGRPTCWTSLAPASTPRERWVCRGRRPRLLVLRAYGSIMLGDTAHAGQDADEADTPPRPARGLLGPGSRRSHAGAIAQAKHRFGTRPSILRGRPPVRASRLRRPGRPASRIARPCSTALRRSPRRDPHAEPRDPGRHRQR